MILEDVAMLAMPNRRSELYVERLGREGLSPAFVLVLSDPAGKATPGQRQSDLGGAFLHRLESLGIPHALAASADVNSAPVIDALRERREGYVIYSGPGGAILGREILGLGKKFIHVHPGHLPGFRGSTTVYYQMLASPTVGATAIFMEERIDEGPMLGAGEFPQPGKGKDLDYEYDPEVRAEVMAATLARYAREGAFRPQAQPAGGETYYIMHPVLRHIARLKVET